MLGGSEAALRAMSSGMGLPDGARFGNRACETQVVISGSEMDSESGEEEDMAVSGGERRGVKRERAEPEAGAAAAGFSVAGGVAGAKPGKKTRGRVKIKMEFIDNKLRRYTTFSKRKTGIMKKAYELSTLTGTQVLLLVASETGHVYTFATRKLQPMITSETGKALIQTCLNSPDSPPRADSSTDQRMSATGFEETDLTYQVSEADGLPEPKDLMKPTFNPVNVSTVCTSSTSQSSPTQSPSSLAVIQTQSTGPPLSSWPVSTGMNSHSVANSNSTVLKAGGAAAGVVQLPGAFALMSGGPGSQQLQTIQVHTSPPSGDSSPEIIQNSTSPTISQTAVVTSVPSSLAGHVMYPSAVMYAASSSSLPDRGLTVLNPFTSPATAMHVAHSQSQESGAVPQMFLTGPQGTVQIPVSAVPLHSMLINQQPGGSSSPATLTELRVVNLDSTKGD
ncbi:serum response factor-like [Astyanax mexicanus]|uniref:Serum response factor n=1 Tax=Astyanax mexicanus TaxID=7994 RepID=A0A8T2L7V9_ASTMX|nr:serum response factor-like [Astyanax mexicanus]